MTPLPPISLAHFFRIWFLLGIQSWGGGSATLLLIRREVVERQHWMSEDEFTRAWGICQIAPGINLLGLTILIGWRLVRAPGAVLALVGLLLPSITITALLTAGYAQVRDQPLMQAALRGVVPGTVGLGLLLSWQMVRPIISVARREGWASLIFTIGLVAGAALTMLFWRPPVIAVLLAGGAIGALWNMLPAARK
ncbi:MAG: chromate transporter [Oscillochloris sp.]|nr:chromate transporter [Oscillochloris sp.]